MASTPSDALITENSGPLNLQEKDLALFKKEKIFTTPLTTTMLLKPTQVVKLSWGLAAFFISS